MKFFLPHTENPQLWCSFQRILCIAGMQIFGYLLESNLWQTDRICLQIDFKCVTSFSVKFVLSNRLPIILNNPLQLVIQANTPTTCNSLFRSNKFLRTATGNGHHVCSNGFGCQVHDEEVKERFHLSPLLISPTLCTRNPLPVHLPWDIVNGIC